MGSGVSTPLSPSVLEALNALGEAQKKDEGKSDDDLQALLQEHLPSIIIFNQIDCDHSGSVSAKELKRALIALPRHGRSVGDGKEPPFMPFEGLVKELDADDDGNITLTEWLTNLPKLPGLQKAIAASIDPATGKLEKYRSLEEQLALRIEQKTALEAKVAAGEEVDEEELKKRTEQTEALTTQLGSAGVMFFRQMDTDGSCKVDRQELLNALQALPRPEGSFKKVPLEEIIKTLDVDGDGLIDQDEWLARIETLPGLKASIEQAVDPETGKIPDCNFALLSSPAQKPVAKEEESDVAAIGDSAEEHEASAKLQSLHRGKKAREEVEKKKAEVAQQKKDADDVAAIGDGDEEHAASAKLQSRYRGTKAREEVEKKKVEVAQQKKNAEEKEGEGE